MKKKRIYRLGGLMLGTALAITALTGCGAKKTEETNEAVYEETSSTAIEIEETTGQGTDGGTQEQTAPESETFTEEESQTPLAPIPEEEQESGEDYELDVKVMALEVGADESHMTLVWEAADTDGQVVRIWKVGEEDDYLDYGSELEWTRDGDVEHYVADIFNLEPGTRYGYKVGREDEWSENHYFATKYDGPGFEFLAAGDPQIGTHDSYEDGQAWEQALRQMTEQTGSVHFLMSLGDMADEGDNKYQYDLFMMPEEMKSMAVATLVGNHDGEYYGTYFKMPNLDPMERGFSGKIGMESSDYYFTYGDTLFLCLNSNDLDYDTHKSFMADTIERYTQANGSRPRWIIAAMHHSVFSITDHLDSTNYYERQETMAPMFSELGVDVVLMGHDHSHARTYPMYGLTPDVVKNEDGSRPTTVQQKEGQTIYFTLNSSTGSKYYEQKDIGEMIAFNNQEEVPNMTKVTVRADKIIFTTCRVEENASILEEFTLLHR